MSKEETVRKLVEAYRSEDLSEGYVPLSSGDKSFLELHKNFPYLETHYSPDYPDMDDILTARSINTFIRRDKERNNPIAGEDFAAAGRTRNPKYNQDHGYMPDEDAAVYFPHSVNEGFFGGYKWNPDVAHQFLNDLQDKAVKNNYYFEPMENNIVGRGLVFVEKGLKNADILHHIYWTHNGIFVLKPKFSIKTSIVTATGKHGTDFETHHDTHHDLLSALDQHFDYAKKQYKTINKKTVVNEAESGSTTAATPAAPSAPAKKENIAKRAVKRVGKWARKKIQKTGEFLTVPRKSNIRDPDFGKPKPDKYAEPSVGFDSHEHGYIDVGDTGERKVTESGKTFKRVSFKMHGKGKGTNNPNALTNHIWVPVDHSLERAARHHYGPSTLEHMYTHQDTEVPKTPKIESFYEAVEVPLDGDIKKAISTVINYTAEGMRNPRRSTTVRTKPTVPSIDPQTLENLGDHLKRAMKENVVERPDPTEDDGITPNPFREKDKNRNGKEHESEDVRRERERSDRAPMSEEAYVIKYRFKNTLKEGTTKPWNDYEKAVLHAQKMNASLLYENIQIIGK